ncbi:MAG: response regulator [Polyangia bacterium]
MNRVLIVDDDVHAADAVALLLENEAAEVRVAYGGASALAACTAFGPTLVFVDIGMPDMNGYELARQIHALRLTRAPILVALTAWAPEHDTVRAYEARFTKHLMKPATLASILEVLPAPPPW